MKIELSEADFEALAASLERRITERVIRGIVAGGVNDSIGNAVKTVATEYWASNQHKFSAADELDRLIRQNSGRELKNMVTAAVREVHADDPELKKMVAKYIFESIKELADRFDPENYE